MAEVKNRTTEQNSAAEGHHDLVGQPHSDEEGPIAEAQILAEKMSSDEQPSGHSVVDSIADPRSTSG